MICNYCAGRGEYETQDAVTCEVTTHNCHRCKGYGTEPTTLYPNGERKHSSQIIAQALAVFWMIDRKRHQDADVK